MWSPDMALMAALDETDLVAVVSNLTKVVDGLARQDQRFFLGFGVFETTAVVTSAFVTGYVLTEDPTGRQHAHDVSELRVYLAWRSAMLFLLGHVVFTIFVIVLELQHGWSGKDLFWLVMLMYAPWAPVAKQVRLTLGAWKGVRSMMRARAVSNTLVAVMREGFYLGYAGISIATTGREVFGLSPRPIRDKMCSMSCFFSGDVGKIDDKVQKALSNADGLPQTKAAVRRGWPLRKVSWWRRLAIRYVICLDPLAWWWSMDPQVLLEDPFEHLWVEPDARTPARRRLTGSWVTAVINPLAIVAARCAVPFMAFGNQFAGRFVNHRVARFANDITAFPPRMLGRLKGWLSPPKGCLSYQRVRIMDVIDQLQPGGTLSEERVLVLRSHSMCGRCIMAVRAAVETFLESSSRQHSGARVAKWLSGVRVDCSGGVAACLDLMWGACFDDNAGVRVHVRSHRAAADAIGGAPPPVSKTDLTRWFLLLLFVVSRSLLREASSLRNVDRIVRKRLDPNFFWGVFRDVLGTKLMDVYSTTMTFENLSARAVDELLDEALAETVDVHVVGMVVEELRAALIDVTDYQANVCCMGRSRLCDDGACLLHQSNAVLTFLPLSPAPMCAPVRTQPSPPV